MARVFVMGDSTCSPESVDYIFGYEFGKLLAKKGFTVLSSARKGISEAVFRGASSVDTKSVRIAVDCVEINLPRNNCFSKEIIADNYFDMKMKSCINSDAFVFFSGGFDVLSDLSILLNLKQLELMGNKPIICIGEQLQGVLDSLFFYNEDALESSITKVVIVDTIAEAIDYINTFFNV